MGKRSASCALALPASSPQRSKLCNVQSQRMISRERIAIEDVTTYPEELLQIRVIHRRRTIAKDDLR